MLNSPQRQMSYPSNGEGGGEWQWSALASLPCVRLGEKEATPTIQRRPCLSSSAATQLLSSRPYKNSHMHLGGGPLLLSRHFHFPLSPLLFCAARCLLLPSSPPPLSLSKHHHRASEMRKKREAPLPFHLLGSQYICSWKRGKGGREGKGENNDTIRLQAERDGDPCEGRLFAPLFLLSLSRQDLFFLFLSVGRVGGFPLPSITPSVRSGLRPIGSVRPTDRPSAVFGEGSDLKHLPPFSLDSFPLIGNGGGERRKKRMV